MLSDVQYLRVAYAAALNSPDPSTQNGAILVRDSGHIAAMACNEFPPGVILTPERLERPLKYQYIEHAERNVILSAARVGRRCDGMTMFCPWFACSDCARTIICSGVKKIVGHQRMMDATPDHWKESIKHALIMLEEAGIETKLIKGEMGSTVQPIRFNGVLWQP